MFWQESYRLSTGKIYHLLDLQETAICVKVHKPRKEFKLGEVLYSYQFLNPDADQYSLSYTQFRTEPLENYSWNLLDNYVITRGFATDENSDIVQVSLCHNVLRLYE